MNFEFFIPSHIIFGPEKAKNVGSYVEHLGKRALIVTGKSSAKKMGYTDMVVDSLKKVGIDAFIFDEVEQDPSFITVDRGAEKARKNEVDFVIGLGGGSPMDAAKGIAFGAKNPGSIADYMDGKEGVKALPIVLITTTAGTGSEANCTAVFTDPDTKIKKSFKTSSIFSTYSVVDPKLMMTLPKDITASTGIDVFFHAFEAYIGKNSQPITDIFALEAIKLVVSNLPKAYEEGENLEYREKMAWANTFAGMAINLSGTCGIHALGQTVGGLYDIAHGKSISAVSLAFIRFAAPEVPHKISKIASLFKIDTKGLTSTDIAKEFLDVFEGFLDNLNLPKNLSIFGIEKKDVDMLAEVTMRTRKSSLMSSPKTPNFEQVKKMFLNSI